MKGKKSDVNGVKGRKTLVSKPPTHTRRDRISHLPDDILHHIISFLPQEAAATTMFLSKRWLNFWTTNLPFFHLKFRDCSGPRGHRGFSSPNSRMLKFFEKVLACPRRDKSIVIQKFCLSIRCCSSSDFCCCKNVTASRVKNLITKVIRQGVREVDLQFSNVWLQFSSPLFASSYDSLTSLNLSCGAMPFPTLFSFPNLKTMHLRNVVLYTNFAFQLINCQKLEKLFLWFCEFIDSNLIPYDAFCLHPLPNLLKASISLDTYSLDILRVISNTEALYLQPPEQQFQEVDNFPKFQNLKYLDFGVLKIDATMHFVASLLRNSPALESLNIYTLSMKGVIGDGTLSDCRPSEHLKLIKIGEMSFPNTQLIKFVKFFLEEARGLEKMIIDVQTYFERERKIVCQELKASPRFDVVELINMYY